MLALLIADRRAPSGAADAPCIAAAREAVRLFELQDRGAVLPASGRPDVHFVAVGLLALFIGAGLAVRGPDDPILLAAKRAVALLRTVE